jgi:hypothetical protein
MSAITRQTVLGLALFFSLASASFAQESKETNAKPSDVTITALASGEHVRFTAPFSLVQIRLEVYNSAGSKVFDNEVRAAISPIGTCLSVGLSRLLITPTFASSP